MTVARQHRAKDQDRCAHLADDVVVGRVVADVVARQRQHLPVLQRGDLGPQRLQKRGHGADVRQPRRVRQRQRLVGQQRGGHQRQAGVLGPGNRDVAVQRAVPANQDLVHLSLAFVRRVRALDPRLRLVLVVVAATVRAVAGLFLAPLQVGAKRGPAAGKAVGCRGTGRIGKTSGHPAQLPAPPAEVHKGRARRSWRWRGQDGGQFRTSPQYRYKGKDGAVRED